MSFDKTLQGRLSRLEIRSPEYEARYLATYPIFLEYFKTYLSRDNPAENDAKAAVVLIYTWMRPAMLDPSCLNKYESAREALSKCRNGGISECDVDALRQFVGGSLIATSKFLHFLNPEHFAILDRHVAWAAYRYKFKYKRSDTKKYLEYLTDLRAFRLSQKVEKKVTKVLGDVSSLRRKEFALFQLGASESKR